MSARNPPPSLAEFLAAPAETVAAVAPPTAVYTPGGTRRRARMEGHPIDRTYVDHYRPELLENCAHFFRLGIRHLIVPCLGPRQLQEVGNQYGEQILDWVVHVISGPEALADYQRFGWRARIICRAPRAEIQAAAARIQATPAGGPTLWYYLVADEDEPWTDLFAAVRQSGAQTRAEAARALYGEDIPPATLYVGFGKLILGGTWIPPLLTGADLHCYWTQRAGLRLTEEMLRRILYDYTYARHTWYPDRYQRYAYAAQAPWDTTSIIGVGSQVGGFWYPNPFPDTGTPTGAQQ